MLDHLYFTFGDLTLWVASEEGCLACLRSSSNS